MIVVLSRRYVGFKDLTVEDQIIYAMRAALLSDHYLKADERDAEQIFMRVDDR